jgi:hypothetical protein
LNRGAGFYPWTVDWPTVIVCLGGGLLFVVGLYLALRQGRIEHGSTDDPAKQHIETYAGIVSTAHNKPTVFITVLIVFVVVWVIGYVVNIAVHGLGTEERSMSSIKGNGDNVPPVESHEHNSHVDHGWGDFKTWAIIIGLSVALVVTSLIMYTVIGKHTLKDWNLGYPATAPSILLPRL